MNRSVMAQRAASRPVRITLPKHLTVPISPDRAMSPVRNRRAPRMTATQKSANGGRSLWNRSPYAPKGGWQ